MVSIQEKITYSDFRHMEIPDGDTSIIEVYVLENQHYTLLDLFEIEGKIKSALFVDLDLDVKEIFS